MTEDTLWEEYFTDSREDRARRLDNAAMADPTKFSSAETEMAELLADVLGHTPNDPGWHARWLLTKCSGDYDGLRRLITALRMQGDLDWVQLKRRNVYSLRSWLAEEYTKEQQAEEQRLAAKTSEGRIARYASHPGVQM